MKNLKIKNIAVASAFVIGNLVASTVNSAVLFNGDYSQTLALSSTIGSLPNPSSQIGSFDSQAAGTIFYVKYASSTSSAGFYIVDSSTRLIILSNLNANGNGAGAALSPQSVGPARTLSGQYFYVMGNPNSFPFTITGLCISNLSLSECESQSSSNSITPLLPPSSIASLLPPSLGRSAALVDEAPAAYKTAISTLSGAALERAVREITPTGTSAAGSSSSGTANTVSGMIFEKAGTFSGDMSGIRAAQTRLSDAYALLGALPSSNMGFEQIATTFAAKPMAYQPTRMTHSGKKFANAEAGDYDKFEAGRVGGWLQGYHDRGHGDTIGASTGFINKTFGIVGALEYAVDKNHLAGLYVAQSKTKSEMYDAAGNVDGNQTMFGLYGQKIEDSFKFSGSLAYGLSRYDSTRNISTVANISPAKAKYDGDTYIASLGVSRMLKSGENTIEPFALVNYTITQTDGYSESGATGYNLTVGKSRSELGSLTVGSIFMFPYKWDGKSVEFKVKPAIRFSDEFKKSDTATSFVGSSTTTIYDARRIDKKTGMIGAEMNLMQDKDTSIKFGVDYQEGKDYASYKLFGQYEWKF